MTDRIRWTHNGKEIELFLVGKRLFNADAENGDHNCIIAGQAQVYRATRGDTGAAVAVKLAKTTEHNIFLEKEEDRYQRLKRACLDWQGWLLDFQGSGLLDGRRFLVLAWHEQSLRDRFPAPTATPNLASGPGPSLGERLRWAAAACEAVAAFHAGAGSQIVHQDIKPGNFLVASVEPPRLLLADFAGSRGLVRRANGQSSVALGAVTKDYAPPELSLLTPDQKPMVTADRFSLAVTVYELVTRDRPNREASWAHNADGKKLCECINKDSMGELRSKERPIYDRLKSTPLPGLLEHEEPLLDKSFETRLLAAFGERRGASPRADRLGNALRVALNVLPERRLMPPELLGQLCLDLAREVGEADAAEPPRPKPRTLPRSNQQASVMQGGGPRETDPPPATPPPTPSPAPLPSRKGLPIGVVGLGVLALVVGCVGLPVAGWLGWSAGRTKEPADAVPARGPAATAPAADGPSAPLPPWEREDADWQALGIPTLHLMKADGYRLPVTKGSKERRVVTLSSPVALAEVETTRALWAASGGPETTRRKDGDGLACTAVLGDSKAMDERPITCVTVVEVLHWLNGLSKSAGYAEVYTIEAGQVTWHPDRAGFRLPTRDEWEAGAWRPGDRAPKFGGGSASTAHVAHYTSRGGWWVEGEPQLLHTVGTWEGDADDAWTLRDPHGNTSELVWTEPTTNTNPSARALQGSSAKPWKCLGGGVTWNIDDDLAQTLSYQDSALLGSAQSIALDAGFRLAWGATTVDRESTPTSKQGATP